VSRGPTSEAKAQDALASLFGDDEPAKAADDDLSDADKLFK
jgi:hypothetical protein